LGGGPSLPSGAGVACAISTGAVCACDEEVANCAAVRVVVASSTRRSFVMNLKSLKISETTNNLLVGRVSAMAINS
jgi:ribosomal protein L28